MQACPKLIDRFKEREENVKVCKINAWSCIVKRSLTRGTVVTDGCFQHIHWSVTANRKCHKRSNWHRWIKVNSASFHSISNYGWSVTLMMNFANKIYNFDRCSAKWLLKQEVSKIVKSINRQLREKSVKTKVRKCEFFFSAWFLFGILKTPYRFVGWCILCFERTCGRPAWLPCWSYWFTSSWNWKSA